MPTCPECHHRFRTLEDEEHDHPCPRCGYHPGNEYAIDDGASWYEWRTAAGDLVSGSRYRTYKDALADLENKPGHVLFTYVADRRSTS